MTTNTTTTALLSSVNIPLVCPVGFVQFNNLCYTFIKKKIKITFAKKNCESVNAKLVEPTNNETNHWLAQIAREKFGQPYNYWLGIHDSKNENV